MFPTSPHQELLTPVVPTRQSSAPSLGAWPQATLSSSFVPVASGILLCPSLPRARTQLMPMKLKWPVTKAIQLPRWLFSHPSSHQLFLSFRKTSPRLQKTFWERRPRHPSGSGHRVRNPSSPGLSWRDTLDHRWQTQGLWAKSSPSPCFIWPGTLFLPSGSTEPLLNC